MMMALNAETENDYGSERWNWEERWLWTSELRSDDGSERQNQEW